MYYVPPQTEVMFPIRLAIMSCRERLFDIVRRDPSHCYTDPDPNLTKTCMYVHDDKPRCMFGYLFAEMGVPLDELELRNQADVTSLIREHLLRNGFVTFALEGNLVVNYLQYMQAKQDQRRSGAGSSGTPWRDVLLRGEESLVDKGIIDWPEHEGI